MNRLKRAYALLKARNNKSAISRRRRNKFCTTAVLQRARLRRLDTAILALSKRRLIREQPAYYRNRAALFFETFALENTQAVRLTDKLPTVLKTFPGLYANVVASRTLLAFKLLALVHDLPGHAA